jgi:DNA invertase Pin-like site-specific DNA recombinase
VDIACYIRVSTEEQSLERQLEATHEYAENLGAEPYEIETYRDKSTGTNTNRRQFRQMLSDVESGMYDAVVVQSVSRVARSIRDFDDTVDKIVEGCETQLHIIDEKFELMPGEEDPYQRAMLQILGVFAELEAKMAQQRTRDGLRTRMEEDGYHHGPAPLGFDKNDGRLIQAGEYDHVVVTLQQVAKGNMSKREAAGELDCARATVNRALERAELYGIDTDDTVPAGSCNYQNCKHSTMRGQVFCEKHENLASND